MTALSKAFTAIADAQIDPDSPIDTALLTAIRDSLVNLQEWLGASYTAGAAQNHNHDGVNSALVPVGPNFLRNGSFESGLAGWTTAAYTGGTIAAQTTGNMDGAYALAITSTVLANGGGTATSDEFISVTAGNSYSISNSLKASAANISSKLEMIWYNSAKSQISASTIYSFTNTPTTALDIVGECVAPTNARFMRIRATGGVPASGSVTGTIYFDGFRLQFSTNHVFYEVPGTYTFVMPADVVYVAVQGAGGSGNAGGYSGPSGAYGEGYVYAPKGTSVTVTVSAGLAFNVGGNAAATSFGSYISAGGGGAAYPAAVTPAAAALGAPFVILMPGSTVGTLYGNGHDAWLNNTKGIYNTAGQSADGKFGGGGAAPGVSSGTGKGGDGFVSIKW